MGFRCSRAEAIDVELLPKAKYVENVYCDKEGYVAKIHTEEIGRISLLLGGGRETKESEIDLSVGIVLQKKRADCVKKDDVLAVVHGNDKEKLELAKQRLLEAYVISEVCVTKEPVIKNIIQA